MKGTAAQELATLKPGVDLPEEPARKLLDEPIVSVDEARRWHGKGAGRKVTFTEVGACSGGVWGWYVAVSRRGGRRTGQRGFRALVAGPFLLRKQAEMRCRELRVGYCLSHADCALNMKLALACHERSMSTTPIRSGSKEGGNG